MDIIYCFLGFWTKTSSSNTGKEQGPWLWPNPTSHSLLDADLFLELVLELGQYIEGLPTQMISLVCGPGPMYSAQHGKRAMVKIRDFK